MTMTIADRMAVCTIHRVRAWDGVRGGLDVGLGFGFGFGFVGLSMGFLLPLSPHVRECNAPGYS
jgi:hypothetical protein